MDERKLYEIPVVEITYFEVEDILTTSGGNGNDSGSGNGSIQLPDVSWGQ